MNKKTLFSSVQRVKRTSRCTTTTTLTGSGTMCRCAEDQHNKNMVPDKCKAQLGGDTSQAKTIFDQEDTEPEYQNI